MDGIAEIAALLREIRDGLRARKEKAERVPTVEEIYGKPLNELTAPEGWEFTGEFRIAKPGDVVMGLREDDSATPFLILRRKPEPPKRHRITVEATGEVRQSREGEWFMVEDASFGYGESDSAFPIYRIVSEENRP